MIMTSTSTSYWDVLYPLTEKTSCDTKSKQTKAKEKIICGSGDIGKETRTVSAFLFWINSFYYWPELTHVHHKYLNQVIMRSKRMLREEQGQMHKKVFDYAPTVILWWKFMDHISKYLKL